MARQPLSSEQVETRRAEILDAAQDLFETQGATAVSLRRVAARVGCSYTTPYRYFDGKEAVVAGLRIRAYEKIGEKLEAARASEPQAIEGLRALSRAYVDFALERPETYGLLYRIPPNGEEDDPALTRAKHDALDVCRLAIARAEEEGDLALNTDPLTAAHLFWASAHGAVSLHLGGQLVMGRSLDDIVPILIGTLTRGLARPPGGDE